MITNNIWRAIGNFFTDYAFIPFDNIRFTESWVIQNIINWIFIIITTVAFLYWMGQLKKFKREGTE